MSRILWVEKYREVVVQIHKHTQIHTLAITKILGSFALVISILKEVDLRTRDSSKRKRRSVSLLKYYYNFRKVRFKRGLREMSPRETSAINIEC